MKQFGISDQDLEAMEERFAGMMENGDMDPPAAMMQQLGMMAPQDDADGDEAPDDDTDEGGDGDLRPAATQRSFGIFGGRRKTKKRRRRK